MSRHHLAEPENPDPSVLGKEEFQKGNRANFVRSLLGELIGTGIFVFLGCGSAAAPGSNAVRAALGFGLAGTVIIRLLVFISGGHINPAITIALGIARRCSVIRVLSYIIAQLAGAMLGASILYAVSPGESSLGVTKLSVGSLSGIGIEIVITFLLVGIVFAVTDPQHPESGGCAPIFIGLAIAAGILIAADSTGGSMNPARSFGPAVIKGSFSHHWVYWVGPIVGGILAGLCYKFLLTSFGSSKQDDNP